jgi:hypothetical protein
MDLSARLILTNFNFPTDEKINEDDRILDQTVGFPTYNVNPFIQALPNDDVSHLLHSDPGFCPPYPYEPDRRAMYDHSFGIDHADSLWPPYGTTLPAAAAAADDDDNNNSEEDTLQENGQDDEPQEPTEFVFPAPDDVPIILPQESPAPSEPPVTLSTVPEEDSISVNSTSTLQENLSSKQSPWVLQEGGHREVLRVWCSFSSGPTWSW